MFQRYLKKFFAFVVFAFLFPTPIFALTFPDFYSDHVIVYDMTDDEVLYAKNSEEQSDIASLTKILTTITAIESIENLDEQVTYTSNIRSMVRWDASVAGLQVGEKYSYRDLLYASILPSGADATITLAVSSFGSVDHFVQKMNELATSIGMTHSHFVNVTGLDEEGHYSTAEDVLILLKYALRNDLFREIFMTKSYTLGTGKVVNSTLGLYNKKNMYDTSRILGSKTGFTLGAGLCISVYFESNAHDMILITMGAEKNDDSYHLSDAIRIIDFIDQNYHDQTLVTSGDPVWMIDVEHSEIDHYELKSSQTIQKYLPDDYDESLFHVLYDGVEKISFWTKENEFLGTVSYYYDDELLKMEDFFLVGTISPSISKLLIAYRYWIICGFLLLFGFICILVWKRKESK